MIKKMAPHRLSPRSSFAKDMEVGLPTGYTFLKVLGEGGFGRVLKCWKKDTRDIVAVKIPKYVHWTSTKELLFLEDFMRKDFDKKNIVKFFDSFHVDNGRALVFENLDISLEDFMVRNESSPLKLSDVRSITQQVANAFEALQSIRVIHTDIKPDNIMLVDHRKRPLKVKLIDFGLALNHNQTKPGQTLQTAFFRAPEIILGLPFTEAIDMWSLGCIMGSMLMGSVLFPAQNEYRTLQMIGELGLLDLPETWVLDKGKKTSHYFKKTMNDGWRLKTPSEYWGDSPPKTYGRKKFRCLDDMKKMLLERTNQFEGLEREQSVELMKKMLTVNQDDRITPQEVLRHPFILPSPHHRYGSSKMQTICEKQDARSLWDLPRPSNVRLPEIKSDDSLTPPMSRSASGGPEYSAPSISCAFLPKDFKWIRTEAVEKKKNPRVQKLNVKKFKAQLREDAKKLKEERKKWDQKKKEEKRRKEQKKRDEQEEWERKRIEKAIREEQRKKQWRDAEEQMKKEKQDKSPFTPSAVRNAVRKCGKSVCDFFRGSTLHATCAANFSCTDIYSCCRTISASPVRQSSLSLSSVPV